MSKSILTFLLFAIVLSCKTKKALPATDPLYKVYENYLDSFSVNESVAIRDSLQIDGPDSASKKKNYEYYDGKAKNFADSMDKYMQLWLKR